MPPSARFIKINSFQSIQINDLNQSLWLDFIWLITINILLWQFVLLRLVLDQLVMVPAFLPWFPFPTWFLLSAIGVHVFLYGIIKWVINAGFAFHESGDALGLTQEVAVEVDNYTRRWICTTHSDFIWTKAEFPDTTQVHLLLSIQSSARQGWEMGAILPSTISNGYNGSILSDLPVLLLLLWGFLCCC